MILYLDTSSMVKMYVEERGSEQVLALAREARTVATSWLSYTEARSAFARKYRDGLISLAEYEESVENFEREWGLGYLALDVSTDILLDAGNLAARQGLRALDAIHLASALRVVDGPGAPASLTFSSADERLLAAAEAEGLSCARG